MGPKALVMADWSTVRHGQLASALVVFDAAAAQQALAPPPRAAAEWR